MKPLIDQSTPLSGSSTSNTVTISDNLSTHVTPAVCPTCGTCPTCGKGGHYATPYVPYTYPVYPHYPLTWNVWNDTNTGGHTASNTVTAIV
jgi:hypothetical protein